MEGITHAACGVPGELHCGGDMEGDHCAGAEAGEEPLSSTDEAVQAYLHFL